LSDSFLANATNCLASHYIQQLQS